MGLTISRRVAGPRCFRYNNAPTFATDIKGISMTNSLVLTESDDGITVVTLNRPEALNALSRALRGAIVDTFERLRTDAATQVIILTGAGRAFTAGLDLKELGGERDADASGINDRDLLRVFDEVGRPIIGAINGYAITGGFEIALMCDFLIASYAGEVRRYARPRRRRSRLGTVAAAAAPDRDQSRERAVADRQLSERGTRLRMGAGESRRRAGGVCCRRAKHWRATFSTTDPATRSEIRRIMDQGWNATLGEGMAIEHDASRQHSRRELTPEKVASRRKGIQERGRSQSH